MKQKPAKKPLDESKNYAFLTTVPWRVKKPWGSELIYCNQEPDNTTHGYCTKFLRFRPGGVTSLHRHRGKDETLTILSGWVKLILWNDDHTKIDACIILSKDGERQSIRIRPWTWHQISSSVKAVVVEGSSYHSDSDTDRVAD